MGGWEDGYGYGIGITSIKPQDAKLYFYTQTHLQDAQPAYLNAWTNIRSGRKWKPDTTFTNLPSKDLISKGFCIWKLISFALMGVLMRMVQLSPSRKISSKVPRLRLSLRLKWLTPGARQLINRKTKLCDSCMQPFNTWSFTTLLYFREKINKQHNHRLQPQWL